MKEATVPYRTKDSPGDPVPEPWSHPWHDRLGLLYHRAMAEKIGRQPELLEVAKAANEKAIEAWKVGSKDGWIELTDAERAAFRTRIESADAQVVAKNPQVKDLLALLRQKAQSLK